MQFSTSEVQKLKNQLLEIGEKRVEGKFCAPDGSSPAGAEDVADLYIRCTKWADIVLERYA